MAGFASRRVEPRVWAVVPNARLQLVNRILVCVGPFLSWPIAINAEVFTSRAASVVHARVGSCVADARALPSGMAGAVRSPPAWRLVDTRWIAVLLPPVVVDLAEVLGVRLPTAARNTTRLRCWQTLSDRCRTGVTRLAPPFPVGLTPSTGNMRPIASFYSADPACQRHRLAPAPCRARCVSSRSCRSKRTSMTRWTPSPRSKNAVAVKCAGTADPPDTDTDAGPACA